MVLLALLWLIPSGLFFSAFTHGWIPTWHAIGVPSFTPSFLDLRVITSGGLTLHNGGDPLVANPFDPLHRTLNYPRIWLTLFSFFRINDGNVVVFGLTLCAIFLACATHMIVRSRDSVEALVVLVSSLSLASFYGMERGNIDLLIFSIVYFSCVIKRQYLKSLLLALAAVLKIYPIAGMIMALIRGPLRARMVQIATALAVAGVFVWELRDIVLIRNSTPVSSYLSFGAFSIRELVNYYATRLGLLLNHLHLLGLIVIFSHWLIVAIILLVAWFSRLHLDEAIQQSQDRSELFSIFGALYAFCFLLGSNWDYRLILLVPTLPFMFLLANTHRFRAWSIFYWGLVVFAQNSLLLKFHYGVVLSQLATFAVFLFVMSVLALQAKTFLLREITATRTQTAE